MLDSLRSQLEYLTERLFESEDRHFQHRINLLIEENDKVIGKRTEGFEYLGQCYGRDGLFLNPQFASSLSRSLMPQMAEILQFRKNTEFDRKLITQILAKLVQPCQSIEDMRNALPECIISLDSYLPTIQRTREPAWTIVGNARDLRQYEKVLPKIETYCAMRFLY